MSDPYFLKSGYQSRLEPDYFVDEDLNAICQPDVYPEAAAVARRLGAHRIVDFGCGTAGKLAELHPEFEIVGIDYGANIDACQERYDFGTWLEIDFDHDETHSHRKYLPGGLLVCADVIEHLVRPDRLLAMLREALDAGAVALFLSTPERELCNEPGHLGPPPNPAHVREWSTAELQRLMAAHGLRGHFGLTRSNSAEPYMWNILAVIPGSNAAHRETIAEWWSDRARWERLAVEQSRAVAEKERLLQEYERAKDWLEGQRAAWQRTAEEALASKAEQVRWLEEQRARWQAAGRHRPDGPEAPGQALTPGSPQVTVITEVDDAGVELGGVASSLAEQTFRGWEWAIVTTDEGVAAPAREERGRVVRASSRARALRAAVEGAADYVVLLGADERLPATALEKWLWFLDAHPGCAAVDSSSAGLRDTTRGGLMIRRAAIESAGSLDAAAAVARGSRGFVPIPDDGPEAGWGHRHPDYIQPANEWLPQDLPATNPRETTGRRLLLVVPWMTVGGADKFNLDLLDQLGRFGWEVTVATTIDGSHELYPDYERRTRDLFPLAHFLPLPHHPRFLHYLVQSRRPDVVLVSNSELGYRLLPYLRAFGPDTPLVDFCHSEAEHWNNGGYPRFSVEYGQLLDLTITASDHLRRWMVERGGDAQRIAVCTANVDVQAFRPDAAARARLHERLRIPAEEPVVLFVGRISEDKQPRVLADVLVRLRDRGVDFAAVVAGDGPDRHWLERAIAKGGLRDRVHFVGSVDPTEIASLMAGSDVLFLPSRSEGIALALYESMASGVPVVGALVGGQAELVTPDCGVLVERSTAAEEGAAYAEALEGLLRDPERRTAMGDAARVRAETLFPLERMGERLNELLDRAIELHRTDPKPVPVPDLARASATEAIELMRLAWLAEVAWWHAISGGGLRGVGTLVYVLVQRAGRPAYGWGMRRGWSWLPSLRDALSRALTGSPR